MIKKIIINKFTTRKTHCQKQPIKFFIEQKIKPEAGDRNLKSKL
jgi:hypothetical protein